MNLEDMSDGRAEDPVTVAEIKLRTVSEHISTPPGGLQQYLLCESGQTEQAGTCAVERVPPR